MVRKKEGRKERGGGKVGRERLFLMWNFED
jgi:hypothetical protein